MSTGRSDSSADDLSSEPTSSPMTDSVVEIRDLRKEYPGVVAVNDIDLTIREGEFFTILGPSGSGKSTLLQMLTGIETPTSGDIFISDERVNDLKPYQRATSLVFQEYALFPHMTAQENVEYGLMLRGVDEETRNQRAKEMFQLMDLQGKEDRQVTELSGGERQRVATARSLIIEPELLLLDEVLGSLDEKLAKEMQVELKRLQEEIEKTFVFVTHSQEEAFSMSDRIAVMHEGDVVQVGTPLEVYQNPANEFVANFLGVRNILSGVVIDVDRNRVSVESNGREFEIQPDGKNLPSQGDEIGFFIPNERIVINGERTNTINGEIIDTIFKGSATEYAIAVGDREEFRVHETTGQSLFKEGSEVTIGFDPDAAKILQ